MVRIFTLPTDYLPNRSDLRATFQRSRDFREDSSASTNFKLNLGFEFEPDFSRTVMWTEM